MRTTSLSLEKQPPAWLCLEDGSVFRGLSIGAAGTRLGEIVFNTCATGYQEILTDPSYRGQIVLMTYPEIGNYGVNTEDLESCRIHASGFVVKRLSPVTSNWRASSTLEQFLAEHGVVGIQGIDTRTVTRRIRDAGAMRAGITTDGALLDTFVDFVRAQPDLSEQNLVAQVTTAEPYVLHSDAPAATSAMPAVNRLVVLDFGIKKGILDALREYVREIVVLPASATFADILARRPDGVLLSNGPGDPAILHHPIAVARELIASGIPTFGICLGHQILALASGARVSKMPFGHHGGNHPVKDLETGIIGITSQNHGYAVSPDGLPAGVMAVTHINLNDGSIEGFRHLEAPVFSVQFHPEANPGPHDTRGLFTRFIREITRVQAQAGQAPALAGTQ